MNFSQKETALLGKLRPVYDGPLGPRLHSSGEATLTLWSPSAITVEVVLYDQKDSSKVYHEGILMMKGSKGQWQVTLNKKNTGLSSLDGYYYHYRINRKGESVLALDPYAPSMALWNKQDKNLQGSPVGKGAIINPGSLGPELAFAKIPGYEKREDAIIYEIHVRDFTSDPYLDGKLENPFGTFDAFIEKLDYIKNLGVTHIQLLPVMSYYFADESKSKERSLTYSSSGNNYNWGYDPHSYFSLTGMYSCNPEDPKDRIISFKNLIKAIHDREMGVILDVVYNHTASVHILEDLEPFYYHFMNADGTPRESFGGGRLGTTHKMARRLLIDSILYWVEEFKIDGFRFDMMGDHDAETIQIAYDESKRRNPYVLMIGEGWRTYAGDEGIQNVMAADQDWMQYTESVGSFSDEFRNELKSGYGSEGEPRFLTGGPRYLPLIFDNMSAMPHNFKTSHPGDVVPYIEAHDNLTLHDVIAQSIKKDPKDHQEEIHKRIRLGNLMLLTSQGTAFLHGGQEYGRTKQFLHPEFQRPVENPPYKSTYMADDQGQPFLYPYFIHDSYNSSDAINRFDWERVENKEKYPHHHQTMEYTKGLIHLRRSINAFRIGTMFGIMQRVSRLYSPDLKEWDLAIALRLENLEGDAAYYVIINADDHTRRITLEKDLTPGEILVDSERAGTTPLHDPKGVVIDPYSVTLEPLTATIIRVRRSHRGY